MPSEAGKLALVPLVAVAVALGLSGLHGRRTHDPESARKAVATLGPSDEPRVAKAALDAFFEGGWVDWDVKTDVEIACGPDRVRDPVACARRARAIVVRHEATEESIYRGYTWLAWAATVPALAVLFLGASQFLAARRQRQARSA